MNQAAKLIAFEKVKKTIESCETIQQFNATDRMIDNFKELYCHEYDEYTATLDNLWLEKVGKLNNTEELNN